MEEITINIVIIQYSRAMQDIIDYFRDYSFSIMGYLDNDYQKKLLEAREYFRKNIIGRNKVSAVSLHNGLLYRMINKEVVLELFTANKADLIILSPVYGVVHAFEKIRLYRVNNDHRYVRIWLRMGIDRLLANYIRNRRARKVYGFFSKRSPYAKIFYSLMKRLVNIRAYFITVDICRSGSGFVITRSLGKAINYLLLNNYLPRVIDDCVLRKN